MTKQKSKHWYLFLIKGIVMFLFAVLIFTNPGNASLSVILYLGIALIFTGLIVIIQGVSDRKVNKNWGMKVFEGAIDLILGFSFINHPLATIAAIPVLIGFWASLYGVLLAVDGFSSEKGKGMKIFSGIFILLTGIMIMHDPLGTDLVFTFWMGLILLVVGAYNIIRSFSTE